MVITAFPVGFFAGLFGIGGGLITVPFLFFLFEAIGVDKNYLMHLAVGTSFAIIIPTSMVSVYTHNKHKSVDTNIIKTYGLFVILGVLLGTTFAAMMKTKSLVIFFTIVVFCLGTYMLINSNQQSVSKNPNKPIIWSPEGSKVTLRRTLQLQTAIFRLFSAGMGSNLLGTSKKV